MYAIALHDELTGQLLLSRDPFGIKPLYYAETSSGFAFASEPQALVAAGLVAPVLEPRARDELLQLHFVTGAKTPFQGIVRLLPGETIAVKAGRIVERRRRPALPESGSAQLSEAAALRALDSAILNSVEVHQRADVPYGLFLSGGIDSSAVLAAMARLNERPVRAFTAGFAGSGVADERARARIVAHAVSAEHIEIAVTEDDFWTLLPEIAAAVDDPTADYALVPTYMLARVAARELKVVLTGEGGDELFAGYSRYRRALRPRWLGGRPMRARGVFDGLDLLRTVPHGWRDGFAATEGSATGGDRSRLQRLQVSDCVDWLPNDLLIKLDRCLMAFGLEGRTPFLDPVMAAFAMGLPDKFKIRRGMGKWLLRRWLETALPEAAALGPKRGFTVPVADWMTRQGKRLGPLLARDPAIEEICQPGAVQSLFESPGLHNGAPAWTLLYYALWHRRHIRELEPAGDVFDCLGEVA